MAITGITNDPQDFRTVYNPIEYVATSNKTAEARFKYIVEVYDGATKIGTLKVPADPNGYGRADVQGIMESYLTKDLGDITASISAFDDCTNSYKEFTIKFLEEYEIAGVLTVSSVYFTKTLITYNGCLPNYRDTITFSAYQVADKFEDYTVNAATRKFLTNIPKGVRPPDPNTQSVELTDKGFTYFLTGTGGDIDQYKVFAYNSSNVLITTAVVTSVVAVNKMAVIPSSPDSLNSLDASVVSISQPIIPTNCDHYYIELYKSASAASEKIHFDVTSECRYEVRRLEFLNSLGGFDTFNFTKVSRKSEAIERKFYKQNPDDMTAAGVIDYSLTDKVKTQYYTKSSPKIKLNSDNISVDIYNWLVELIESPEIYMWENGERIAVQNIQGNWEQKRADTDSVFNLEIEVELGIDNYRQRG
tara:strand:+ start:249 stop:1502 length:1254 start_codon:yes stop_codon:yes gene_type:complete